MDGTYGQARRQRKYLEDALSVVHSEYIKNSANNDTENKENINNSNHTSNDNNDNKVNSLKYDECRKSDNRHVRLNTPPKLPVVKLDLGMNI